MQLQSLENLRLTDRNKAGANAIIDYNGKPIKAELNYYLQGNQCLSIRLGRHDNDVSTTLLEEFIRSDLSRLKKMIEPDIARLKQERLEKLMQNNS